MHNTCGENPRLFKKNKTWSFFSKWEFTFLIISFDNAYAEESQTIQVEIKYTNGDRADYNGMKLIIYQDFNKSPILEKTLENNPDVITYLRIINTKLKCMLMECMQM